MTATANFREILRIRIPAWDNILPHQTTVH